MLLYYNINSHVCVLDNLITVTGMQVGSIWKHIAYINYI